MKLLLDLLSLARLLMAACFALVISALFLHPGLALTRDFFDAGMAGPGIPSRARSMHRSLTPRIGAWATDRVESGAASTLWVHDVAGTEWPLFTAVFYLMATEELQADWERAPQGPAPKVYAAESIVAARDLLLDPGHHTWVRQHWGEGYMHEDNLFFRSLLIAGLTSYEALTRDGTTLPLLRDQVDSLVAALDQSKLGLIDDYPGQCYPIDIVPAIGFIRRADQVLGTDHSAFVARSLRGFEGDRVDENGLVPFRVSLPDGGQPYGPARGIGMSWVLVHAPDLWPAEAKKWYASYDELYWRDHGWVAGFREFLESESMDDWMVEIDAGPVVGGLGSTASAFGIAAARKNGRFDHAYALSIQLSASSWILPTGTLAVPRLASSATDAPYVGEAAILYFLTTPPADGVAIVSGGTTPWMVWVAFLVYFGVSGFSYLLLIGSIRRFRARRFLKA